MSSKHAKIRAVSTIGIMGFGAFGRLMARHLRPHFALRIHDPHRQAARDLADAGLAPATVGEVAACDLVILAVPVPALAQAVAALAPHLRAGALVLDVGSVKIGPARALVEGLPRHVEIIGTHPLFGPQSARNGIAGLKIALCPVRGGSTPRIAAFLRHVLKLAVVVTTADAHDREVAMVQGLTHLIAKILVRMEPLPQRMTTASFDLLMQATEMVRYDSPDVFMAIELANPHAKAVRDRFFTLAEELRLALEHGEPRPSASQAPHAGDRIAAA